ncbi:hypothetical protein MMC28_010521 [Mycoblastus sanguinarius]|nr:hypothetical protein [Mycoblastus sanguinarius]
MDTPKSSARNQSVLQFPSVSALQGTKQPYRAPRSALRVLSNGMFGSTPTGRAPQSQSSKSTSVKKINPGVRRQISKSYGDLSKLRPKSPPLPNLTVHWPDVSPPAPGDSVGQSSEFTHQPHNRQPIPSEWRTKPDEKPRPVITPWEAAFTRPPIHQSTYSLSTSPSNKQFINPLGNWSSTIAIQGLNPQAQRPLDFYLPVVRPYPDNGREHREPIFTAQAPLVKHIDVSSIWKGLSFTTAEDLFRVHKAFTVTLETMLAGQLWVIHQQLQEQYAKISSGNSLQNPLTGKATRGISFSSAQLTDGMCNILGYSPKEENALSGLLRIYLAASDCLVRFNGDSLRDTSITVRVHSYPPLSVPQLAVEAAWAPDAILFENLDEFPREGQEFLITPQYQSNSAFQYPSSPIIRYSIDLPHSEVAWLVWDDDIAGFRGTVPMYSELRRGNGFFESIDRGYCDCPNDDVVHVLSIQVQAVLNYNDGSPVGFERMVRAQLTFQVTSRDASNISTHIRGKEPLRTTNCRENQFDWHSSSATASKNIELIHLAQSYARLAEMYVDLAERHAETERHVMNLSSIRGVGMKETQLPELQRYFSNGLEAQPYLSRRTRRFRLGSGSTKSPRPPEHASERLVAPPSPVLVGRDSVQNQDHNAVVDPDTNARLSVLPPPAFNFVASAKLNEEERTLNAESATTSLRVQEEAPATAVEQQSRKGQARSSLDAQSLLKRSREACNIPNHEITVTGRAEREANQSQASINRTRRSNAPTPDSVSVLFRAPLSASDPVTDGRFPNDPFSPGWSIQGPLCGRADGPITSLFEWDADVSSSSSSRVPSSNVELIIEQDQQLRRVSRREQAMLWKVATHSKNNKQKSEVEVKEPRLGDDERKAMDEAVKRSLEDITGAFDGIFLYDNSESGSNSSKPDEL